MKKRVCFFTYIISHCNPLVSITVYLITWWVLLSKVDSEGRIYFLAYFWKQKKEQKKNVRPYASTNCLTTSLSSLLFWHILFGLLLCIFWRKENNFISCHTCCTLKLTSKMLIGLCLNKLYCSIKPCTTFIQCILYQNVFIFNAVKKQSGNGFVVDALFGNFAYLHNLHTNRSRTAGIRCIDKFWQSA